MSRIKNLFKESTILSPVMEGKEKIDVKEDVIYTITAIDVIALPNERTNEKEPVSVYATTEGFFFGGKVLTDLAISVMNGSSIDEIAAELAVEPLKIKLHKKQHKTNKSVVYTSVEIVD